MTLRTLIALFPVVLMGLAHSGCGAGAVADAVRPESISYQDASGGGDGECIEGAQFPRVMVVDWKADHRVDLEAAMKGGVAVVSYGCDGVHLLPQCMLRGRYNYVGVTTRKEVIKLNNSDEVRANLPLSGVGIAGRLDTELNRGASLDIGMHMVGKRVTARTSAESGELGGACKGATHFVQAATVGAFVMRTGEQAAVALDADLWSVDVSAKTTSEREVLNHDGDPEACGSANPDDPAPPAQCGSPLLLSLVALNTDAPALAEARVDGFCPEGFVLSQGKCARPDPAVAHQCKFGDAKQCFDQCDRGHVGSCATLATMLDLGEGVPEDRARGIVLASKACDAGNSDGCMRAGVMLKRDEKFAPAAEYISRACEAGNGRACALLGYLRANGIGVDKDKASSEELYARSCRGGYPDGCVEVALSEPLGVGDDEHDVEAFALLDGACDSGGKYACARVGQFYLRGIGTKADATRGLGILQGLCDGKGSQWLILYACIAYATASEAHMQTNEAFRDLEDLHDKISNTGRAWYESSPDMGGVASDIHSDFRQGVGQRYDKLPKRDVERLEKSCQKTDYGPACYAVGQMYERGLSGLAKDDAKAVDAYQWGCLSGDQSSCAALGRYVERGTEEVERSREGAAGLYAYACQGNGGPGCVGLAGLYWDGRGVPEDRDRAVALYQRGCEALNLRYRGSSTMRGYGRVDPEACFRLAGLYESGDAVDKDPVKSAEYYRAACSMGYGQACTKAVDSVFGNPSATEATRKKASGLLSKSCMEGVAEACDRVVKECKSGDAIACTSASSMYAKGKGVNKDPERALALARTGCDRQDYSSCKRAFEMLTTKRSNSIAADHVAAVALMVGACKRFSDKACGDAADRMDKKRGSYADAYDPQGAVKLLEIACKRADDRACFEVYKILDRGRNGVTKDDNRAKASAQVACRRAAKDGSLEEKKNKKKRGRRKNYYAELCQ
jgi:TPR repeat protein